MILSSICSCFAYLSPDRLRTLALIVVCFHSSLATVVLADSLESRVDAAFADLDSTHSAGCAVAVVRDGKTVFANGYGMANLDHGVPITPETIFDIGSTSKQFTAAAIALLALDGRLALDDDVRKHIPELPGYDKTITVRQLLHHTSGVRDYDLLLILSGLDDHDVFSYRDLVDLTARQQNLNFTPGDTHLYSNTGYILLAVIVERVSGLTIGEFVAQRIFAPLGMVHSLVYEDRDRIVPHRATGYSRSKDGSLRMDHYWNFALGGDGQIYTTVGDLALWDSNFYDPRVGGAGFLEMMRTRGELNSGESIDYALGLFHGDYRGLQTVSHGGAWGGFRAQFIRVPEQRFSAVVLCNLGTSGPDKRAHELIDIYLEEHLSPEKETQVVAVDPGVLSSYEGQYLLEIGILATITSNDGYLWVQSGDSPLMKLVTLSNTDFNSPELSARISFSNGDGDGTQGLTVYMGGDEIPGKRIEPYQAAARTLEEYIGNYYSDELDMIWRMGVQDRGLVMHVGLNSKFELQFIAEDTFISDDFLGVFQRGADHSVNGLVLNASRVKNLRAIRQPETR